VSNFTKIAGQQNIVAELWKEYALSDSRYLTDDAVVFSLEAIAVASYFSSLKPFLTSQFILGPLSLLTAYLTVTRNPRRHFLQTVVSVTHLYGVVIYYFSSLVNIVLKEQSHCRPEARYVWGYFIGGNIPWLIVPACKFGRCRLPRLLLMF
jgi:cholestenol Delta-isomerase